MNRGNRDLIDRRSLLWSFTILLIAAAAMVLATLGTASADDPTGSISGTVNESDGTTPIVGAVVFVNDFVTGDAAGNTTTDALGGYTVGGLATGDYRVHVNATDQDIPLQYYTSSPTTAGAVSVPVVDGSDTANIDFTMATAGQIVGTVFETDGTTPISAAHLWETRFDGTGGGRGALSAGDGTYAIAGIAPGDYRVDASAEAQGFVREFFDEAAGHDLASAVTVTGDNSITAIDFTLAAGGSIAGTVYADDGGAPLEGVRVWAGRYDEGGGNGTTTNAQGDYTIPGLVAGDYRVRAEPDSSLAAEFYNDTRDWGQADRVGVTAGATTIDIDFSLAAGGSISGTVTRESDGSPVGGADVWAHTYECCGGGNGTTTAADGSFTLPGLAPDDYRVQVRPQDVDLVGEFFPSTTDWHLAGRVTVTAGTDTSGIDYSLPAGGTVAGVVTQSDGTTPIEGVWVQATDFGTGAYANGAPSASDGSYSISGVRPGTYRVETWVPPELNFSREFYPSTTDWGLAGPVVVNVGATTPNIDFSLDGGGSISGRVLGPDGSTPVANANVWADSYVCCGGGNGTHTDDNGDYTISGLAAGSYRVQADAPGQGLVRQFYSSTDDWGLALPVDVTAGVDTPGIEFQLGDGGSIAGTVYDSGGTPVTNADIWADTYDCCGGGNGVRTDNNGDYVIGGLAGGDYRVGVRTHGQGYAGQFFDSTTDWELATRVGVDVGTTTPSIDFYLEAGGSISGTVTSELDGAPIPGADVWANSYDCCGGGNGARTALDGSFTIDGLAAGSYRVGVQVHGQDYAGEFYTSTSDWNQAMPVAVTAGTETPNIDFSLPQGGAIAGTVYEADGTTPVPGADVWANQYDCCGGGNGTRTDANGDYVITGLAPADYRVGTHAPPGGLVGEFYTSTTDWNSAMRVGVAAGATTQDIDFTLDGGGSISGTVTRESDDSPVNGADVFANTFDCCGGGNGTRTAADGTYTIDGLAAGAYRVEVNAFGQGLVRELYPSTTNWSLATPVTVDVGQDTPDIDFSLTGGGSISGTIFVQNSSSTPLAGANVWAGDFFGEGGHGYSRSSSDGTYTIDGLAAGDYRVEAEADGLVHEVYDDTTQWHLASPVTVADSADTPGIDFTLTSGGTITGTVYDGSMTPVASASVNASSYDGDGGWGWARTAADGTYTMTGLATGDYRVQADASEQGLTRQFYSSSDDWGLAMRVSAAAGQTTENIDFVLGAGGTIAGTVYSEIDGSPIPGADVWADRYDCCGGGNGDRTALDGTYLIQGLSTGDYRVRADTHQQAFVSEYYTSTTDWSQAERVAVTSGATTPDIDFSLATGGSISGTVVDQITGQPIAGADLWAEAYDCCGGGSGARTGADGTYTIDGLSAGDFRVTASTYQLGYVREFYPSTTNWNLATRVAVDVDVGQDTPGIDFSLVSGGSISGTVTRQIDGTPVADADVRSDTYDCCGGGNGTRTEADGTYTIDGLASGDFRVQVRADSQGLVGEFYESTTDWSAATRVPVVTGANTAGIDFSLPGGGSISGSVLESDGTTPIVGANVFAQSDTAGWGHTQTIGDGTYQINGLGAGSYRVEAEASGRGFVREFYTSTVDYSMATLVDVTEGSETAGIDFTLDQGGSVSGMVYDTDGTTPLAGVNISAFSEGGSSGHTRSGPDGSYMLEGLATDDYRVEADASDRGYFRVFYDGATGYDDATLVPVTVGADTPNIDFTMLVGGSITGQVVTDNPGAPIGGVDVWAQTYDCCGGGGNGARTLPDGTYEITGLAPGDYRVRAQKPEEGLVGEFFDDTSDWGQAARVAVLAGAVTQDIDFALGVGGSLSGFVYEADGTTPIPGANVWANQFVCCGGGNGALTDGDGSYEINGLAPGDYRVTAEKPGFSFEMFSETANYESATPVTVTANADTPNVNFTLDEAGTISGTVYEADGTTPIPDANIWANADGGGGNGAETNPDGTYVIESLAAGGYTVSASKDGYATEFFLETQRYSSATPVIVVAGADTPNVDFTLELPGSISGIVYEADGVTPIAEAIVRANATAGCCGRGAVTAADGMYTIEGLTPGSYVVNARGDGFAREFYQETPNYDSSTPVAVAAGTNVPDIDFTLDPGGSVSGTVLHAVGGAPVEGAYMFVMPAAQPWPPMDDNLISGSSAADGTYTIGGVPLGDWVVIAWASSQGLVLQFHDHTLDPASSTPVTVTEGADSAGIDFDLVEGGSISGTVTDATGTTPIEGILIIAETEPGELFLGFGESEPDGTYSIMGLPAGDYILTALDEEDLGYEDEYYDGVVDRGSATLVTVVGTADTPNRDFTLEASP